MTRLLVTGSREWSDVAFLERKLEDLYQDLVTSGQESCTVIHGDCPDGADHHAAEWINKHGLPYEAHPANWNRYGNSAGFKRNELMVNLGADMCVAFLTPGCKGTVHCAALAQDAGIPVLAYFMSPGALVGHREHSDMVFPNTKHL